MRSKGEEPLETIQIAGNAKQIRGDQQQHFFHLAHPFLSIDDQCLRRLPFLSSTHFAQFSDQTRRNTLQFLREQKTLFFPPRPENERERERDLFRLFGLAVAFDQASEDDFQDHQQRLTRISTEIVKQIQIILLADL